MFYYSYLKLLRSDVIFFPNIIVAALLCSQFVCLERKEAWKMFVKSITSLARLNWVEIRVTKYDVKMKSKSFDFFHRCCWKLIQFDAKTRIWAQLKLFKAKENFV